MMEMYMQGRQGVPVTEDVEYLLAEALYQAAYESEDPDPVKFGAAFVKDYEAILDSISGRDSFREGARDIGRWGNVLDAMAKANLLYHGSVVDGSNLEYPGLLAVIRKAFGKIEGDSAPYTRQRWLRALVELGKRSLPESDLSGALDFLLEQIKLAPANMNRTKELIAFTADMSIRMSGADLKKLADAHVEFLQAVKGTGYDELTLRQAAQGLGKIVARPAFRREDRIAMMAELKDLLESVRGTTKDAQLMRVGLATAYMQAFVDEQNLREGGEGDKILEQLALIFAVTSDDGKKTPFAMDNFMPNLIAIFKGASTAQVRGQRLAELPGTLRDELNRQTGKAEEKPAPDDGVWLHAEMRAAEIVRSLREAGAGKVEQQNALLRELLNLVPQLPGEKYEAFLDDLLLNPPALDASLHPTLLSVVRQLASRAHDLNAQSLARRKIGALQALDAKAAGYAGQSELTVEYVNGLVMNLGDHDLALLASDTALTAVEQAAAKGDWKEEEKLGLLAGFVNLGLRYAGNHPSIPGLTARMISLLEKMSADRSKAEIARAEIANGLSYALTLTDRDPEVLRRAGNWALAQMRQIMTDLDKQLASPDMVMIVDILGYAYASMGKDERLLARGFMLDASRKNAEALKSGIPETLARMLAADLGLDEVQEDEILPSARSLFSKVAAPPDTDKAVGLFAYAGKWEDLLHEMGPAADAESRGRKLGDYLKKLQDDMARLSGKSGGVSEDAVPDDGIWTRRRNELRAAIFGDEDEDVKATPYSRMDASQLVLALEAVTKEDKESHRTRLAIAFELSLRAEEAVEALKEHPGQTGTAVREKDLQAQTTLRQAIAAATAQLKRMQDRSELSFRARSGLLRVLKESGKTTKLIPEIYNVTSRVLVEDLETYKGASPAEAAFRRETAQALPLILGRSLSGEGKRDAYQRLLALLAEAPADLVVVEGIAEALEAGAHAFGPSDEVKGEPGRIFAEALGRTDAKTPEGLKALAALGDALYQSLSSLPFASVDLSASILKKLEELDGGSVEAAEAGRGLAFALSESVKALGKDAYADYAAALGRVLFRMRGETEAHFGFYEAAHEVLKNLMTDPPIDGDAEVRFREAMAGLAPVLKDLLTSIDGIAAPAHKARSALVFVLGRALSIAELSDLQPYVDAIFEAWRKMEGSPTGKQENKARRYMVHVLAGILMQKGKIEKSMANRFVELMLAEALFPALEGAKTNTAEMPARFAQFLAFAESSATPEIFRGKVAEFVGGQNDSVTRGQPAAETKPGPGEGTVDETLWLWAADAEPQHSEMRTRTADDALAELDKMFQDMVRDLEPGEPVSTIASNFSQETEAVFHQILPEHVPAAMAGIRERFGRPWTSEDQLNAYWYGLAYALVGLPDDEGGEERAATTETLMASWQAVKGNDWLSEQVRDLIMVAMGRIFQSLDEDGLKNAVRRWTEGYAAIQAANAGKLAGAKSLVSGLAYLIPRISLSEFPELVRLLQGLANEMAAKGARVENWAYVIDEFGEMARRAGPEDLGLIQDAAYDAYEKGEKVWKSDTNFDNAFGRFLAVLHYRVQGLETPRDTSDDVNHNLALIYEAALKTNLARPARERIAPVMRQAVAFMEQTQDDRALRIQRLGEYARGLRHDAERLQPGKAEKPAPADDLWTAVEAGAKPSELRSIEDFKRVVARARENLDKNSTVPVLWGLDGTISSAPASMLDAMWDEAVNVLYAGPSRQVEHWTDIPVAFAGRIPRAQAVDKAAQVAGVLAALDHSDPNSAGKSDFYRAFLLELMVEYEKPGGQKDFSLYPAFAETWLKALEKAAASLTERGLEQSALSDLLYRAVINAKDDAAVRVLAPRVLQLLENAKGETPGAQNARAFLMKAFSHLTTLQPENAAELKRRAAAWVRDYLSSAKTFDVEELAAYGQFMLSIRGLPQGEPGAAFRDNYLRALKAAQPTVSEVPAQVLSELLLQDLGIDGENRDAAKNVFEGFFGRQSASFFRGYGEKPLFIRAGRWNELLTRLKEVTDPDKMSGLLNGYLDILADVETRQTAPAGETPAAAEPDETLWLKGELRVQPEEGERAAYDEFVKLVAEFMTQEAPPGEVGSYFASDAFRNKLEGPVRKLKPSSIVAGLRQAFERVDTATPEGRSAFRQWVLTFQVLERSMPSGQIFGVEILDLFREALSKIPEKEKGSKNPLWASIMAAYSVIASKFDLSIIAGTVDLLLEESRAGGNYAYAGLAMQSLPRHKMLPADLSRLGLALAQRAVPVARALAAPADKVTQKELNEELVDILDGLWRVAGAEGFPAGQAAGILDSLNPLAGEEALFQTVRANPNNKLIDVLYSLVLILSTGNANGKPSVNLQLMGALRSAFSGESAQRAKIWGGIAQALQAAPDVRLGKLESYLAGFEDEQARQKPAEESAAPENQAPDDGVWLRGELRTYNEQQAPLNKQKRPAYDEFVKLVSSFIAQEPPASEAAFRESTKALGKRLGVPVRNLGSEELISGARQILREIDPSTPQGFKALRQWALALYALEEALPRGLKFGPGMVEVFREAFDKISEKGRLNPLWNEMTLAFTVIGRNVQSAVLGSAVDLFLDESRSAGDYSGVGSSTQSWPLEEIPLEVRARFALSLAGRIAPLASSLTAAPDASRNYLSSEMGNVLFGLGNVLRTKDFPAGQAAKVLDVLSPLVEDDAALQAFSGQNETTFIHVLGTLVFFLSTGKPDLPVLEERPVIQAIQNAFFGKPVRRKEIWREILQALQAPQGERFPKIERYLAASEDEQARQRPGESAAEPPAHDELWMRTQTKRPELRAEPMPANLLLDMFLVKGQIGERALKELFDSLDKQEPKELEELGGRLKKIFENPASIADTPFYQNRKLEALLKAMQPRASTGFKLPAALHPAFVAAAGVIKSQSLLEDRQNIELALKGLFNDWRRYKKTFSTQTRLAIAAQWADAFTEFSGSAEGLKNFASFFGMIDEWQPYEDYEAASVPLQEMIRKDSERLLGYLELLPAAKEGYAAVAGLAAPELFSHMPDLGAFYRVLVGRLEAAAGKTPDAMKSVIYLSVLYEVIEAHAERGIKDDFTQEDFTRLDGILEKLQVVSPGTPEGLILWRESAAVQSVLVDLLPSSRMEALNRRMAAAIPELQRHYTSPESLPSSDDSTFHLMATALGEAWAKSLWRILGNEKEPKPAGYGKGASLISVFGGAYASLVIWLRGPGGREVTTGMLSQLASLAARKDLDKKQMAGLVDEFKKATFEHLKRFGPSAAAESSKEPPPDDLWLTAEVGGASRPELRTDTPAATTLLNQFLALKGRPNHRAMRETAKQLYETLDQQTPEELGRLAERLKAIFENPASIEDDDLFQRIKLEELLNVLRPQRLALLGGPAHLVKPLEPALVAAAGALKTQWQLKDTRNATGTLDNIFDTWRGYAKSLSPQTRLAFVSAWLDALPDLAGAAPERARAAQIALKLAASWYSYAQDEETREGYRDMMRGAGGKILTYLDNMPADAQSLSGISALDFASTLIRVEDLGAVYRLLVGRLEPTEGGALSPEKISTYLTVISAVLRVHDDRSYKADFKAEDFVKLDGILQRLLAATAPNTPAGILVWRDAAAVFARLADALPADQLKDFNKRIGAFIPELKRFFSPGTTLDNNFNDIYPVMASEMGKAWAKSLWRALGREKEYSEFVSDPTVTGKLGSAYQLLALSLLRRGGAAITEGALNDLEAIGIRSGDKKEILGLIAGFEKTTMENVQRFDGTAAQEPPKEAPADELWLGKSELRSLTQALTGAAAIDAGKAARDLEALRAGGQTAPAVADAVRKGVMRGIDEAEQEAVQNAAVLTDNLLGLKESERGAPLGVFGNLFGRFGAFRTARLDADVTRFGERLALILQTASGLLGVPQGYAAPETPQFSQEDTAAAETYLAALRSIQQSAMLEYQVGDAWREHADRSALYQGLIDAAINTAIVNRNVRVRLVVNSRDDKKELIRLLNGVSGNLARKLISSGSLAVLTAPERDSKLRVEGPADLVIAPNPEDMLRRSQARESLDAARFGDEKPIAKAASATPAQLLLAGVTALSNKTVHGLQRLENGVIRIENEGALNAFEYMASRLALEAETAAQLKAAA
ncbi:MAG TPA: hypothetical protein VL688_00145 [Verrucomicrobiae bacterium]|nr:hypothetical protein [Verrucomicrobiae bacterium]